MSTMTTSRKQRRRWLRFLIVAVASAIHPLLGVAAGVAIDQGLINVRGTSGSGFDPEDFDTDGIPAENELNSNAIPTLNAMANQIENVIGLPSTGATIFSARDGIDPTHLLNTLNPILKNVAVLQAYTGYLRSTGLRSNILIADTIEVYLAKLNTLVTETLTNNGLQGEIIKTDSQRMDFSSIRVVEKWDLNWRGSIYGTYPILSLKSANTPTEPAVVITPSSDPVVNTVISSTSSDPIITQAVITATGTTTPYGPNTGIVPNIDNTPVNIPVLDASVVNDYVAVDTPITTSTTTNNPTAKKSYTGLKMLGALVVGFTISKLFSSEIPNKKSK